MRKAVNPVLVEEPIGTLEADWEDHVILHIGLRKNAIFGFDT